MRQTRLHIDGRFVTINHYADWSGKAIVSWRGPDGSEHEVLIPGRILVALGREAAREELRGFMIQALEDWGT